MRHPPRPVLLLASAIGLSACLDQKTAQRAIDAIQAGPDKPDVLPAMLNTELPFHYPSDLYARQVQGNTTLRIYIDARGRIHPESTAIVKPSGYEALDSAAVAGIPALRFRPATLKGQPMAVTILFPVLFRHPDAAPLPGDTILKDRKK